MATTVKHVATLIEQIAPPQYAYEWDNSGLQVGAFGQPVEKILVTLTITEAVVERAIAEQVDMIIAHHPLIFQPLRSLDTDNPLGRIIQKLLCSHIAVYTCHTNLDCAPLGLNYWLAELLGLREHYILKAALDGTSGLGRIGLIDSMTLDQLKAKVESVLQTKVRCVGNPGQVCRKIAVCGGSGGELINAAWAQQADVLITGDLKYHTALDAQTLGLALIDAGHFATEKIMVSNVAQYLRKHLLNIPVIEDLTDGDPFSY